jgi:hypothetical protein
MSPIWAVIGQIFHPLAQLIDRVHTSDAERMELRARALALQGELAGRLLDYEARLIEAQTKVIAAEAQGASWLQRNWRPITMLTFLALVVADAFGLTTFRLSDEAWTLLQIGMGGYVVGRSLEKLTPQIARALSAGVDNRKADQ